VLVRSSKISISTALRRRVGKMLSIADLTFASGTG
jgi:hypothetical protein